MIGSLIVRESDGKPYRVVAEDSVSVAAISLNKRPRKIVVSLSKVGRGHGYVVSEPDSKSLDVAKQIVDAAKAASMVSAVTRRGNVVSVFFDGNEFTVRNTSRQLFRSGFAPALTQRLASWGAKLQ